MIKITDKPVVPQEVLDSLKTDVSGSIVTHLAILRPSEEGPKLAFMEYGAERTTTGRELSQIESDIRTKYKVQDVGLWRRMGRLGMGEIILAAAIAAPHRKDAFEACEYAVERLRGMASIRKREIHE